VPTPDEILDGKPFAVLEGDCLDLLPTISGQVEHIITDPPYSDKVHKGVRSNGRAGLAMGNGAPAVRSIDIGFNSLTHTTRRACAGEFARLASRWVMAFSDLELCHMWRRGFEAVGLDYVRTMVWHRLGGSPQFTGDRPAASCEMITLAHPRGRKAWNAGGKRGFYEYAVVHLVEAESLHTTQKPLALMMELIEDFTSPNDIILDPFAGSGTTGLAALRLGRRCILIEQKPEYAAICRERLTAECEGSTLLARKAQQEPLFR
jgi:hypothetical protein